MSVAAGLVLLPALSALLLAAWPAQAARLNVLAAALSLALALALFGAAPGTGILRADAVGTPLVLVAAIVGLGTAVFSLGEVRAAPFPPGLHRLYHASFQGFMAAVFLALLSDNLGIMWVAIEAATLLCVAMVAIHRTPAAIEAAWKFFILCGIGIALALFGIIVPGAGGGAAGAGGRAPVLRRLLEPRRAPMPGCSTSPSSSCWWASAPRPASARCIPGCPTPMPRARRRSPPCCPACC
jgi:hydrogenase-4 component F